MNWQHVRAMARKEWWHLLRDKRSLALMLLMPAMLLFLFGYAIRLDVTEAPIGVLAERLDGETRELVARFDASRGFMVTRVFRSREELRASVQAGEVWGALVIPADFADALLRGDARLQLILDGVDANSARLVRNYARALLDDLARERAVPPLRIDDRVWFNETRESHLAIIPGVIAIVMAVIGALMTSLTVAREMELGNLVMLRTTPLTRGEFLVGKLTPYFVIGMLDLLIAVFAALYLFGVPLRGPFLGLALVSALFLLVVMMQGALISVSAGQQVLASQLALISTFLPAFLLSGFVFAIENMPAALRYITYVVPARYYVELSKAVFLKGLAPFVLWTQVVALATVALLLAAALRARARKLGLVP
ncbi:MAG: ABC transporter permease [Thiohalomonadaceae bacterium]